MIIGFKGYNRSDSIVFSRALTPISYGGIEIKDNLNAIIRNLFTWTDCDTLRCNALFINIDTEDGFDTARLVKRIKRSKPHVIIIATTNIGVDKDIEIALFDANINDVLTGALDPALVLARFENQLKYLKESE